MSGQLIITLKDGTEIVLKNAKLILAPMRLMKRDAKLDRQIMAVFRGGGADAAFRFTRMVAGKLPQFVEISVIPNIIGPPTRDAIEMVDVYELAGFCQFDSVAWFDFRCTRQRGHVIAEIV